MTWHPDMPTEYRDAIVTGDARQLSDSIPSESVDLIFTDPVYDQRDDYLWLAQTARRVLKPSGSVLVWSNGRWHYPNTKWLEEGGLTWRYDFGCIISTGPAPMSGKVIAKTNRVIWLDIDGNSKMSGYLADGYTSLTMSSLYSEWSWTKNPIFCGQAIRAFSRQNAVILDPFAGQGTLPAVAKMHSRHYIGFEIDPTRAEHARIRLIETKIPLPILDPEQLPLAV